VGESVDEGYSGWSGCTIVVVCLEEVRTGVRGGGGRVGVVVGVVQVGDHSVIEDIIRV
jgi:hypothetical protein